MANSNSEERFAIGLYLEKGSDKIVQVSFSTTNAYLNSLTEEQQKYLLQHDLPQVMMAVDNTLTMDSTVEKVTKAINSVPHICFENNIAITASDNNEVSTFMISAVSNEVYENNFGGNTK